MAGLQDTFLDPSHIGGFVEGWLEGIGEDDPDEELLFRNLWDDETQREVVLETLKEDVSFVV